MVKIWHEIGEGWDISGILKSLKSNPSEEFMKYKETMLEQNERCSMGHNIEQCYCDEQYFFDEQDFELYIEDLHDNLKSEFTKEFYHLCDCYLTESLDDLDTPNPWGCPWIWNDDFDFFPNTSIDKQAKLFFYKNKEELQERII